MSQFIRNFPIKIKMSKHFFRMNSGVCPTRPNSSALFTGYQSENSFKLSLHSWYVRLKLIAKKGTSVVGNEQFNVSGKICQGKLTFKTKVSVQQKASYQID